MRVKTIIILAIGVLLTIVFMQNLDPVRFTVLFSTMYVSKITIMLIVGVTTFVLGYLAGRPGRSKYNHIGYDENEAAKSKTNTLSDDDRDYIN